jgi:hypothetical protein
LMEDCFRTMRKHCEKKLLFRSKQNAIWNTVRLMGEYARFTPSTDLKTQRTQTKPLLLRDVDENQKLGDQLRRVHRENNA